MMPALRCFSSVEASSIDCSNRACNANGGIEGQVSGCKIIPSAALSHRTSTFLMVPDSHESDDVNPGQYTIPFIA